MWKYFSVSTSTWGNKVELKATAFTGSRALNMGRSGSMTLNVRDPKVAEAVSKTVLMPWERVLVAEWDGNAVYAGFITNVKENLRQGTVDVTHVDIWDLWKRRHILTLRGNGDQSAPPITWNNRTLATHANLVVNRGMNGEPAGRYDLPLIMTADVVGTESRTYWGYKFQTVESALKEIMETEGGPDIDFDVRWSLGVEQLEWVMRSGNLTSGLWEWDATATETEVYDLELETDATDMTNKLIGTGEGSERSLLVRDNSSFGGTAVALEKVERYDYSDGNQLQAHVNADLAANDAYTQQLSFKIPVTGAVKVGQLILGGTCRLTTSGLYFFDAGQHDWRLIQYDFDHEWITLHMQQIGG